MQRPLLALYGSVLIVTIGFAIALPVMPRYIERLALRDGAGDAVWLHVGALTAAYPLMHLGFASLWGRLSDRIGRKSLVVTGLVGFAITQTLFGLARGLPLLYGARLVGGALSAALLPAASGYVADATSDDERTRGLSMLSLAVALGGVVGPALGAVLARVEIHVVVLSRHLVFDGFSIPFVVAALLAVVALVIALIALDGTKPAFNPRGSQRRAPVHKLLAIGLACYATISLFEATFALFGASRLGLGAEDIAIVFTECGVMMVIAQIGTPALARAVGERVVITSGLGLMCLGFVAFIAVENNAIAFAAVIPLGIGMTLVGPTLTWELARVRQGEVGRVLGAQQSVQALGQVSGAIVGLALLHWSTSAPYTLAAFVVGTVGLVMALRARRR